MASIVLYYINVTKQIRVLRAARLLILIFHHPDHYMDDVISLKKTVNLSIMNYFLLEN